MLMPLFIIKTAVIHFFVCCVLNIISFKNKIGGTSLDVSPACRYHSPPTLLLNVPGQTAAFWETKKNIKYYYSYKDFF